MVVFLFSLLRCPPGGFLYQIFVSTFPPCGQVSELLQGFSELSGSKAAIWAMVIFQPGRTAGKAELEDMEAFVRFVSFT